MKWCAGGHDVFDQTPKKTTALSRPLKAFGLSCVGLLLSLGLCGLDAHLYPKAEFGGSLIATIGAIIGVPSAFLFIGSVFALVIGVIVRAFKD